MVLVRSPEQLHGGRQYLTAKVAAMFFLTMRYEADVEDQGLKPVAMRITVINNGFFKTYLYRYPRKRVPVFNPPQKVANPHPLAKDYTVVMMGWAGCNDKNLTDLAQKLYTSVGIPCLQWVPSTTTFLPTSLSTYGDVSLVTKEIKKLQAEKRKYILHIWSMNSTWALSNILKNPASQDVLKGSSGVVFDSAPATYNPISAGKCMRIVYDVYVTKDMSQFQKTLGVLTSYAVTVHYAASLIYNKMLGRGPEHYCPHAYLKKHPDWPKHQLHLLSDDDIICAPKDLKEFINHQKQKPGFQVIEANFGQSPHCMHFLTDEKKYIQVHRNLLDSIAETEVLQKKKTANQK